MLRSFDMNRWRAFVFLFLQLSGRDIKARYRGTALGILWALVTPLLSLAMYVLVFGTIFKAKWPGVGEGLFDYALYVFCGLVIHGAVSECLARAPTCISTNAGLIKRSRLPTVLLPAVIATTAATHALFAMTVLFAFIWAGHGSLPWEAVLSPFTVIAMLPMLFGLCLLVAATGTYFRDLSQFMPTAAGLLLFVAPIFYPRTAAPDWVRGILSLNPITYPVEALRAFLLEPDMPWFPAIGVTLAAGSVLCALGLAWFRLAERGFARVI